MTVNFEQLSRALTSDFPVVVKGLYPYQVAGVEYICRKRRVLLADEMGVGKTCQAIAALFQLKLNYLVICPASLRDNWMREIKMWTGVDAQKYRPKQTLNPKVPIIATYGQCSHAPNVDKLLTHGFTAMVCDEAHYLKNASAGRTRLVLNKKTFLAKARDAAIFLTGTPIENRPIEIYMVAHALGAIPESLSEFGNRYANPKLNYWSRRIEYEGVKNADELAKRLRSQCMVRRTKAQVLPFLPPKIKREITLDVNPKNLIRQELKYYDKGHLSQAEIEDLRNIRAQLAIIKAPHVIEYIRDVLEEVDKVVVFAWHRTLLTELLIAFAAEATIITGSTPQNVRQGRVDHFQTHPGCRVMLGALTAAGVGFNITASSHVIIAEASWKPGENEQAIDRCHRIGQRHSVLADFLCFPDSADQRVLKACKEKQNFIDAVLR